MKSEKISSLAKEIVKKRAMKNVEDIDFKKIEAIKKEYAKLVDVFINSIQKKLKDQISSLEKWKRDKINRETKRIDDYIKKPDIGNMYTVLNSVFGPNEIRTNDIEYKYNVDGKNKELEKLEKEFKAEVGF